jgi:16S rRNA (guanine(966)-N(2))-methyltransferase RsmD
MRERCFAVLGVRVEGARVLDLFAGTGAVGIEALSRGASSAVFVEAHRSAVKLIRDNLASLGVGGDRARVMNRPALAAVAELARREQAFDLVWADPPFESWTDGLVALTAAVDAGLVAEQATLCLECPADADAASSLPPELMVERDLEGGASRVVLLRARHDR